MTAPAKQPVCVVLGASGFIGSAVAAEAERRGFRVIAVTRQNYEDLRGAACDVVFNANGNSKKFMACNNPPLDFDLSVRSVHAALHDFKTKLYVQLSSIDIYSDMNNPANNREDSPIDTSKLSPYGFHKWLAEQLVMHYAPQWLILRMGGSVGPALQKNAVYDLLKGLPLRVHPDNTYQHIDSRFLAKLAFDLPARGLRNQVINCAGDGAVSVRDIAAMIPRSKLPETAEGAPVHTEVSIDKLKSLVAVPTTRDALVRFIAEVRAGQESLA